MRRKSKECLERTSPFDAQRQRAMVREWALSVAACLSWTGCMGLSVQIDDDSMADDDSALDDDNLADDDSASADDDSAEGDDDTFLEVGTKVPFEVLAEAQGHIYGEPWESMDQEIACAELNVRIARTAAELDALFVEVLPPDANGTIHPEVDFSTSWALLSYLSTCVDEGRLLYVHGITDEGDVLRVANTRLDPCIYDWATGVRPYNLVSIPALDGDREILSHLEITKRDCDE